MIGIKRISSMVAAVAVLALPSLAWGAGFALFEHGNRAMAMGGAFTAVADDLSAMYWNPAGMAFQERDGLETLAGVTFISAIQDFEGAAPYPGDGYETEQKSQIFYPAHLYAAMKVSDQLTLGFSSLTPFGLGTYWDDDFAGRFISKRVELKTFDLSPNFAYKLSDNFAFGGGVDYLIGTLDYTRNIPFLNPYTQQVIDAGQVHMYTDGMGSDGWGWHAGVLVKSDNGFSVGVNYRSRIDVDYEGEGEFYQYPTGYGDLDATLASVIPFGQTTPLVSKITFPELWSLGVAWTGESMIVSFQWNYMGWDTFQELPVTFTDYPALSSAIPENYDYTNCYRLGLEYRMSEKLALQGGLLYDETPQPRQSVSPLLADEDRTGISVGTSYTHGKITVDAGYMLLLFDDSTAADDVHNGYHGTYETMAHLLGVTLGYRF